jgi:hypothetical protein
MTRAIKGIYCVHIRHKTYIAVHTRIVGGEPVLIEGSEHCRYSVLHGCDNVKDCVHIGAAVDEWRADGSYL